MADSSPRSLAGGLKHHVPGLDGIRAIAVIAVLLFHAGVPWVRGGLLGVDVFFVLSGFLVTTILIDEWWRSGTIKFLAFYERRARRLLPGLMVLMVMVVAFIAFIAQPNLVASIRGDALATVSYVANWRFIFSGQDYFVHYGPPSPLLHTWSLAVEEQFYVVWPAAALLALRRGGRRSLALLSIGVLLLSCLVTLWLAHHGASSSRTYYGTDVRAQQVMVGALLAAWLPWIRSWRRSQSMSGRTSASSVLAAGGVLGSLIVIVGFHSIDGSGPFLPNGGYLLIAVATAAIILAVVDLPRSPLGQLLGTDTLGYLGRISYGLYLYHFPVYLLIDGQRTGLSGTALLFVRLGLTLGVSALSYSLIEMPIRRRTMLADRSFMISMGVTGLVVVALLLAVTAIQEPSTASAGTPTVVKPITQGTVTPGTATGPPVKVMVLGDSIALTLGQGLSQGTEPWGVEVLNRGWLGCDLDPNGTVRIQGPPGPAAQGCRNWRAKFKAQIDQVNPDVVALEVGRWEVVDRLINGQWVHIGDPTWDRMFSHQLSQAIDVLAARGAKVAVLTLPYIKGNSEAPDGTPWPANDPERTDTYNAVLKKVVDESGGKAVLIDLNRMINPQGVYTSTVNGVAVRDSDNEHFSPEGGMYLQPLLLPRLRELGVAHRDATGATDTGGR
ncbi:MAG: acyltransferase family protein [Actinomycetes bacterium]